MGFDSNIIQKYKTEHIKPQFLFLSELVRSVCFRRRFKILSQKTTWVVLTWGNGTSFSLIAPNRYVWYTYKMFSTCFIKKKNSPPTKFQKHARLSECRLLSDCNVQNKQCMTSKQYLCMCAIEVD